MNARLCVALAMVLASSNSHAMSVEGYRAVKKDTASAGTNGKLAELLLVGYFQGVAETISVQRGQTNGNVVVTDKLVACVPASVTVSADLLRAALDQEIENHSAQYARIPDWENGFAAHFALRGIARMFPCAPEKH